MSGTKAGAAKAKLTIEQRYSKDFWARIGSTGGKATGIKGFAANPELARIAGAKGGAISRRGKKHE
jgi:uncharacterized protein